MWNKLKTILSWDAFYQGCELHYQLLAAAGLASAVHPLAEIAPTYQSDTVPDTASIDIYPLKGCLHSYILAPTPSTESLFRLN